MIAELFAGDVQWDSALGQHIAVLGTTGYGKSHAAKWLVERTWGDQHTVVIDPTGTWWGLRNSATGDGAGLPIAILGGRYGDADLPPGSGAELGRLVMAHRLDCVLDLSQFTRADMRRFMTGFAEQAFLHCRHTCRLVIDEASDFVPQLIPRDGTTLYANVERILRQGRSRGFRCILINQRAARLHKDALSMCQAVITFKLMSPHDRAALREWIKDQAPRETVDQLVAELPKLKPGLGMIWYPDDDLLSAIRFPALHTFDTGKPVPEDLAQRAIERRGLVAILDEIRALLDAGVGQARPAPQPDRAAAIPFVERQQLIRECEARGERRGFEVGYRAGWEHAISVALPRVHTMQHAIESLGTELTKPIVPPDDVSRFARAHRESISAASSEGAKTDKPNRANGAEQIDKPLGAERKLLVVLLGRHPTPLSPTQLATLAGMSAGGGTFTTYLSRLRTGGWITRDGYHIAPSERAIAELGGQVEAGDHSPPAVRAMWIAALGAGPGRMITALARHPNGLSRIALAHEVGMEASGGSFGTYLSRLRARHLVNVEGQLVALAPELQGGE